MLIQNYGVHWERKYIQYGRPSVAGHLKGYAPGAPEADFREQIGVYVLSDKDLQPVYIGQAGSGERALFDRLKGHEKNHLRNRWEHFSWFGIKKVNRNGALSQHDGIGKLFKVRGIALLNQIEGALITALEPRLNKQGASWQGATQYFQSIDDEKWELTSKDLDASIAQVRAEIHRISKLLTKK